MNPETRTYDKHWIPWLKRELVSRGVAVETPLMPNPWEPDYVAFKKEFEKYPVTRDTVLVGHSCGTTFLVRWLGETKQNVKKLILVAPWIDGRGTEGIKRAFYDFPIDETIASRVEEIVIFTADDEEEDGKRAAKTYQAVFDGKTIELKGRGHYTKNDMGTDEFPELLSEIMGDI